MKAFTIGMIVLIFIVALSAFSIRTLGTMDSGKEFEVSSRNAMNDPSWFSIATEEEPYLVQKCCSNSVEAGILPNGDSAIWFNISRADPLVKGSHRSEFRFLSSAFDTALGFDAEVYIPSDWRVDALPVLLMQWHGVRDRFLLEKGRYPPLELFIAGDEFIVQATTDLRSRTPSNPEPKIIGRAPLIKGEEVFFSIDVIWSPRGDGRILVRMNEQVIANYSGPTAYRDLLPPYFKFGIYSPKWKSIENPEVNERRVAFISARIRPGVFSEN